ncbi:hypothetical protein O6H91_19G025800 [Diphasiastrum complanatum]|uniref:Uncharacterized protein n=1 Tax=Diphasiastrum complanatum TaxID=34168 RepID=A0ACC2ATK3_DIPCM|nr:hypothetical protein O6H91_19G025800 [Diphasiastrum complanatum]
MHDHIRIQGFDIRTKTIPYDCGTSDLVLVYGSKTSITKIELFEVHVKFLPELSISEFRTHCENIIAENPIVHGSVLLATVAVTIFGIGPTGYNRKILLVAYGFEQEDQGQVVFWENSTDLFQDLVGVFHTES